MNIFTNKKTKKLFFPSIKDANLDYEEINYEEYKTEISSDRTVFLNILPTFGVKLTMDLKLFTPEHIDNLGRGKITFASTLDRLDDASLLSNKLGYAGVEIVYLVTAESNFENDMENYKGIEFKVKNIIYLNKTEGNLNIHLAKLMSLFDNISLISENIDFLDYNKIIEEQKKVTEKIEIKNIKQINNYTVSVA